MEKQGACSSIFSLFLVCSLQTRRSVAARI